ncbi:MAG: winged helix-turn-helix domain-containing protein [Chloroflexi bacterium AL-W]|nr:winged helix-turn-helix domain-containing protein [Chloroflexi bacterium AL-N1]NOK65851.1 winged helix-turn-helix domain-containing protein [Chloroflexi bacterium AL-N10]NOK74208.1 winged helix-turn-helix domain-containing protein [Chloroflexi bacterium AL-N5]NOK80884.1 winged helix-turn-helix domain-containing protein [Chloroflexi bacterium AL-W]NOK88466.1 winged helix-turn-helix domain-containing protein [Chloroflexi bacterium AL-N15]
MTHSINTTIQRRFILGKQGLWPGRRWAGKEGTAEALRTVEAVQIDPVSIVASSPDIVLWGRVQDYTPSYLTKLLYTDRRFFDYGGGLMIYPIEELPYWRVMMERRKSEKRWYEFAQANPTLLDRVRQEIRAQGPLRSRDIEGKATEHYRGSKDTGVALYYLWFTGELMTYSRKGTERIYDFLEHVAPANVQWSASESDTIDYFVHKSIAQLGLVTERDFRRILKSVSDRPVSAQEAKTKLRDMLEANQLTSVQLEGSKPSLYLRAADWPCLEALSQQILPESWQPLHSATEEVIFLSPLEYVSARGRAKELFDFDYLWEIYKPAAKRSYGPYTMPVLFGDRLVARIDMKLERDTKTLLLNGLWQEPWFAGGISFHQALAQGLLRFTTFLEAERIDVAALQTNMRIHIKNHIQKTGVSVIT